MCGYAQIRTGIPPVGGLSPACQRRGYMRGPTNATDPQRGIAQSPPPQDWFWGTLYPHPQPRYTRFYGALVLGLIIIYNCPGLSATQSNFMQLSPALASRTPMAERETSHLLKWQVALVRVLAETSGNLWGTERTERTAHHQICVHPPVPFSLLFKGGRQPRLHTPYVAGSVEMKLWQQGLPFLDLVVLLLQARFDLGCARNWRWTVRLRLVACWFGVWIQSPSCNLLQFYWVPQIAWDAWQGTRPGVGHVHLSFGGRGAIQDPLLLCA